MALMVRDTLTSALDRYFAAAAALSDAYQQLYAHPHDEIRRQAVDDARVILHGARRAYLAALSATRGTD